MKGSNPISSYNLRSRAFTAAARRSERPPKARIESALQASRFHYQRTGRCFYITKSVVMGDTSFEELEDYHQFWDPNLLLPENVSREQLYEEHLEAVGAYFAPRCHPLNGPVNSNICGHISSQSSSACNNGSQSQHSLDSGSLDANRVQTFAYPLGAIPVLHSQNYDGTNALSVSASLGSRADNYIDLTSPCATPPPSASKKEDDIDFNEWLHLDYEKETMETPIELVGGPSQEEDNFARSLD